MKKRTILPKQREDSKLYNDDLTLWRDGGKKQLLGAGEAGSELL